MFAARRVAQTLGRRAFSSGGGGAGGAAAVGFVGGAAGAAAFFYSGMLPSKDELSALQSRLDSNDIDAASSTHSVFLFIKPHAVTEPVKDLVKSTLLSKGMTITGEGTIDAKTIDEKMLIDTHYGAIANRAVKLKASELVVPEKAQAAFEKAFGEKWTDAVKAGKVYNALEGCKKLSLDGTQIEKEWRKLKKDVNLIKFGGGFYAGKLADDVYVINAFYMSMREKYTGPGEKIHYYTVDFPAGACSWGELRENVLGATDPTAATPGSLRNVVYKDWKKLGLSACPDTGDNGIHASASPYEALAERINWLGASPEHDTYGKGMIASGVPAQTIRDWGCDPAVKGASLFDQLEDLDAAPCLAKAATLAK